MFDAIDVVVIEEKYVLANSLPAGLLRHARKFVSYLVLGAAMACFLQSFGHTAASYGAEAYSTDPAKVSWRIRFLEAATVSEAQVVLGEIAVPAGDIPPALWKELSARRLWASPPEAGRPVNMTRPRLQQAAVEFLGPEMARLCLYPPSMALQRGGRVMSPAEVQEVVVKTLTPLLGALPGEASLQDFRLPPYVFLSGPGQTLALEVPSRLNPGRLSLQINVRDVDGSVVKRLTGTVFLDCWVNVPCAAAPLNKGDALETDRVTFVRKNLASLREAVWDGRGGPWRMLRPVTLDQVIYQSDLATIPTVAKGSSVTLVYQGGSVSLSATVEALADGVTGETIPVRNISSKKQLYATVRDGNTVFIRPAHQLQASN